MRRLFIPAILVATLSGAGAALADDDDCRSPMSQWQSQDAAMAYVSGLGLTVERLKIDDGCYEVRGRDRDSNRVELKLDPASLGLVELEVKFRPGADPSRYLAGARGVQAAPPRAPAGNRLLAPGSVPQVGGN